MDFSDDLDDDIHLDWDQPLDTSPFSSSSSVILHLDIDCFYAQVEMLLHPEFKDRPLGVQQKNLVITTNYVARNMGIPKSGAVKELREQYPDLVLVNGELLEVQK